MAEKDKQNRTIGLFSLIMINICAVLSLKNLPVLATQGWSMITWYLMFTVFFLIPTALVAAELAFRYPKAGGMYAWIKEAYPGKGSFTSIWAMWFNNVIWYPAGVSYLIVILSYAMSGEGLVHNTLFMGIAMLSAVWGFTAFNMFYNKYSPKLITLGTVFGTVLPLGILLFLAVVWVLTGNVSNLEPFSLQALIPHFDVDSFTFAGNLIFIFAGIEIAGFYISSTRDPHVTAPRATFISSGFNLLISILGTMAVAILVPMAFLTGENGMNGGVIEAFRIVFDSFGLSWLILPLGLLLFLGVIVQISTMMDGPGKGMQRAAMDGLMPPFFRRLGPNGAPRNIFLVHGIVSSFFILIYLVTMNSQFNGYWILTTIATLLVIVKYLFLFLTFLKVRKDHPEVDTGFRFGRGRWGTVLSIIGITTLLFGFVFSLMPPNDYGPFLNVVYICTILATFLLIGLLVPYLIMRFRKESWKPTEEELNEYLRINNELDQ